MLADLIRKLLLVLTFAATVAGAGPAHALQIFETPDDGDGFAYLILNGVIEKDDHKRIAKFLDKQANEGVPVAILMTSQGGGLEETPAIANAIISSSDQLFKKFPKKHNIFAVNEECSSACTILAARLTNKRNANSLEILVTNKSLWGFHSPVNYDSKKVTPIKEKKLREQLIAKEVSYYLKSGANTKWMTEHANMFKSSEMTEYRAEDLCKEAAQIIPASACIDADDITTVIQEKFGKPGKRSESPTDTKPL